MTQGSTGNAKAPWSKLRRYTRFRTDVRVTVTPLAGGGEASAIHGRAGIIAEGGFGATLAGELAIGQAVSAELLLVGAGRAPVRAPAVVRYRRGFRHGFEFLDATSDQRAALRDFCAQLQPAE